jgi:formylglycine-generating enzyme required for sulfatase activity
LYSKNRLGVQLSRFSLTGEGSRRIIGKTGEHEEKIVRRWHRNPDEDPPRLPTERERLLALIHDPKSTPSRRRMAGDRLAKLGDTRNGVGLRKDGLPDFDWVFLRAEGKPHLAPFHIARYPVTWTQFEAFVQAEDGYADVEWWDFSPAAREWRMNTFPLPRRAEWPVPNRPRETVSWYEAVAFCRWSSRRLGMEMRLPTENEWRWAAAGEKGRRFPWGSYYAPGAANIDESELVDDGLHDEHLYRPHQTTAVGIYPRGATPEGVMDLAGNVWEWCYSVWTDSYQPEVAAVIEPTGELSRALRGGAWYTGVDSAQTQARAGLPPGVGDSHVGFRVVRVA